MIYLLISVCVIAIIFLIITKYYLLQNQHYQQKLDQREHFAQQDALSPTEKLKQKYTISITYLSESDAQSLFKESTQYLQNMNQANLAARKCETLSDLYDKYMGSGLQNISDDEKSKIDEFLLTTLDMLAQRNYSLCRYLAYWLRRVSFAKGQEWLESGMPHTLGHTIIMDANWYVTPRITTLFHELIHIHQRDKFFDFEDLYFMLGYFYYPKLIKGMEPYYQLNRNNPDGSSTFWLWHYPDSGLITELPSRMNSDSNSDSTSIQVNSKAKGRIPNDTNNSDYWWIGAVFRSAAPVDVTDVNYIALKLTRGADGTYYLFQNTPTRLDKFKQYNAYMGINDNNYHPNETTAKYMEWYYMDYTNGTTNSAEHLKYDGYKIFKKYMDEYLATFFSKDT